MPPKNKTDKIVFAGQRERIQYENSMAKAGRPVNYGMKKLFK